jgi:hypothetical protein
MGVLVENGNGVLSGLEPKSPRLRQTVSAFSLDHSCMFVYKRKLWLTIS